MNKICFFIVFTCLFHLKMNAQDSSIVFTKNGVPLPVTNTGNNTLLELNKEDSLFSYNIAVAGFQPAKRLAWHYHPGGQVLIITEGAGFYQERGKPKQLVKKGEVIKCMPGVEHWHGASTDKGVAYIAVYSTKKGVTVWLEPVSDKEFNN